MFTREGREDRQTGGRATVVDVAGLGSSFGRCLVSTGSKHAIIRHLLENLIVLGAAVGHSYDRPAPQSH